MGPEAKGSALELKRTEVIEELSGPEGESAESDGGAMHPPGAISAWMRQVTARLVQNRCTETASHARAPTGMPDRV